MLLSLQVTCDDASLGEALGAVISLAREQSLTAYDAAYLHLAMREGLPLATQDDALILAANRVGVPLVP
jgi:predicted nucleic acid-binding protein